MPAVKAESTTPTAAPRREMIRLPALLRSVGLKTLWDERISLLWWASGAGLLTAIIVMIFPAIDVGPEVEMIIERLPPAVQALMGDDIDLTSAQGYVNLRVFGFTAPIIFLVYAIGRGSAAIAGEEERGTLDLLLAHPVRRWRIVVEKGLAMIAGLTVIAIGLWLGIVIGALAVGIELSFSRALQATFMGILFGAMHGGIALAVGATYGRSAMAIGVPIAVIIVGYFLDALGPLVAWLEPFTVLSPWYFYNEHPAMVHGINPLYAGVMLSLAIILTIVAAWRFQQRDVQR